MCLLFAAEQRSVPFRAYCLKAAASCSSRTTHHVSSNSEENIQVVSGHLTMIWNSLWCSRCSWSFSVDSSTPQTELTRWGSATSSFSQCKLPVCVCVCEYCKINTQFFLLWTESNWRTKAAVTMLMCVCRRRLWGDSLKNNSCFAPCWTLLEPTNNVRHESDSSLEEIQPERENKRSLRGKRFLLTRVGWAAVVTYGDLRGLQVDITSQERLMLCSGPSETLWFPGSSHINTNEKSAAQSWEGLILSPTHTRTCWEEHRKGSRQILITCWLQYFR